MSFERAPDLVLYLAGPLRLLRRDGTEATPRVAKAQGILALLGASPALRRSRPWLQDKLWSDQPPENGSDSLRQTIHRLRRAVDVKHDWLTTRPSSARASTSPIPSSKTGSAISASPSRSG